MGLIFDILLCVIICVISEIATYKYIKHIDKKERKRLQVWETEYIDGLVKLKKSGDKKKNVSNSNNTVTN